MPASFFADLPVVNTRKQSDIALLHRMECKACPLAQLNNKNPDMPATGSKNPLVYILGEGPGKDEDEADEQFVGESGQLLRPRIPQKYRKHVRFNNVVRTRPYKNATPEQVAIECCRPSVVRDIEQTKPKAIFGFGNVPLEWVSDFSGITLWRGRKMPVKVGNHVCWYFPMLHPAYLLRQRRGGNPSAEEHIYELDLKRAFAEVEHLPKPRVHAPQDVWKNVEAITTFGSEGLRLIEEGLHWASTLDDFGLDYETDRLRPYHPDARILSASVGNSDRAIAFGLDHPECEWSAAERVKVEDLWVEFLRKAEGRRWVHNLAFELEWTAVELGEELVRIGDWHDTSVQACIIDERKGKNKPGCFSLEFLVQQYFGFNLKKLSNLDRKNLAKAPLDIVLRYNGGDSRYHCLLGLEQEQVILDEDLEEPYILGLRRVPTVVLTQLRGVPVDQKEVKRLQKKYEDRIADLTKQILSLPVIQEYERKKKAKFNPFSNPDILYVLKDMLRFKECEVVDKYTKKIKYSADEGVLEKIKHPLAGLLIRLRKANKRKSTYLDPSQVGHEKSVVHADGLLHPTFNTIFAETGRLSCEEPNLQNDPKREEEAKEVRKRIVPAKNCIIVAVDYGQIEYRVIGMFTKDKVILKALWENYDIHLEWAERIAWAYPKRIGGKKHLLNNAWKVKGSEAAKAMKDLRTDIKNQWTFPLFFGAQLSSVAGYLEVPENIISPLYNEFWRTFSGVKKWQDDLKAFYKENGYVECLTKRRRRGPLSLNQIINSPVQGTAAEIVMDGMCRLSEQNDPDTQPEINIHDDLTFVRVPVDRVDEVAEKIITGMLDVPFPWAKVVPISVEMSVGDNWLEMEEVATYYSHEWFK